MNRKILNVKLYWYVAFVVVSAVFVVFPQIDIAVSSLFYDGKRFTLNGTLFEEIFYYSVKPLLITLFLGSLFVFIYNKITKKTLLNLTSSVMLYIVLVLSIAPGLIVNKTLKDNWGRARPAETTIFGGKKEFTPAFVLSDQDGYSFSSGHSAAAFSLVGFALLFRKKRKTVMFVALSYGVLVSIARMGAGGHFFSDVITSFFIVWIATHIFYRLVFKKDSNV